MCRDLDSARLDSITVTGCRQISPRVDLHRVFAAEDKIKAATKLSEGLGLDCVSLKSRTY